MNATGRAKLDRNTQIQGVRGICIITIVAYHYIYRYCELFENRFDVLWLKVFGSDISVFCFLIISSYYLLPKKNISAKSFIISRLLRLWPPYALSIIIIYTVIKIWGLPGRECSFTDFILSFAFIPGIKKWVYVDGAHWYLAVLFSLVFIVALLHLIKLDRLWISYIIWLLIGWGFHLLGVVPLYRIVGGAYIGIAVTGLSYRLYKEGQFDLCTHFVILLLGCFYTKQLLGNIAVIWLLISYTLLVLCINKKINIVSNKIALFFAEYSYYWYLIHQNIGYVIEYNLRMKYGVNLLIAVIIAVAVTFGLAALLNRIFERT